VPPYGKETVKSLQSVFEIKHLRSQAHFLNTQCETRDYLSDDSLLNLTKIACQCRLELSSQKKCTTESCAQSMEYVRWIAWLSSMQSKVRRKSAAPAGGWVMFAFHQTSVTVFTFLTLRTSMKFKQLSSLCAIITSARISVSLRRMMHNELLLRSS
jgi:hypothetical protein